jgi:hypothetical protein
MSNSSAGYRLKVVPMHRREEDVAIEVSREAQSAIC